MRIVSSRMKAERRQHREDNPHPKLRRKEGVKRRVKKKHAELYNSRHWQRLRLLVLNNQPICAIQGCMRLATEVDHIERHHGDPNKFYALANLQPICRPCHMEKSKLERRGAFK